MISTTITQKNFSMKMEDLKQSGYFVEYKDDKLFWQKRLDKFNSNQDNLNISIVFLVGRTPHNYKVISVWKVSVDFIPERYKNAISTPYAYAIKCKRK